jgi:GNAT superfamily N-acetyltransferase
MIKLFTMNDLQKCCELYVRTFSDEPWYDHWTKETAYARLLELVENKRFIGYTQWHEDELIGAAFCYLKTFQNGLEIFVEEMWVSPDFQRKGYGLALMDEIEKYATENGIVAIALFTGKSKPSFDFYKKCGYKHLEELAFMHKRM